MATKANDNRILTLIGLLKLLNAALLFALGVGAFKLLHHDVAEVVRGWVEALRVDPEDRIVKSVLSAIAGISDRKIEALCVGTFFYASLFVVEGIGLLLHKRWAEYFTVITTGLLMPLEIYELVHRPTILRAVVLVVNAAVVVYLIIQLRRTGQSTAKKPNGVSGKTA